MSAFKQTIAAWGAATTGRRTCRVGCSGGMGMGGGAVAVAGGMVLRGGQNTLARRTEPPTTPCYCGNSCPPAFLTTHFRRPHCGYKSFGPLELGLLLLLYTEKN